MTLAILFKLSMPFSVIGIAFILLGIIMDDSVQLYFGFVWIVIATIAIIYRNKKGKSTK